MRAGLDPDPDWIGIQLGQWIWIQIGNPDPGRPKLLQKKEKKTNFIFIENYVGQELLLEPEVHCRGLGDIRIYDWIGSDPD
jgi:hypothetical protein